MTDAQTLVRLISDLGATGILAFLLYKLVDKWAAQFLGAQKAQADAMASLAEAVKSATTDQREVLLAVRVQSRILEELRDFMQELGEKGVTK